MQVDLRFFDFLGRRTLGELAELVGAELPEGHGTEIFGIASALTATAGTICYAEGNAKLVAAVSPDATACFVTDGLAKHLPTSVIALVTSRPRWSHGRAAQALFRLKSWACDGAEPDVHPNARLAPGAVVCKGAAIGAQTTIGPNSVIGPGVQIGTNCQIGANVSIRNALIGNDVTVLSGARLGENGFGVSEGPDGAEDVPQWGRVILQDHVLIGANSCIDRGALSDTVIGERTKIDNLCQIAHNVVLGRSVLIASFGGISGSVQVGDGTIMGGRVGIADHVTIGAGAKLAASAGIFRDIPAGEAWGGTPGRPLRQFLRETSWLQQQATKGRTGKS